ncbi:hypothetical protein [Virgibacillus phasianinus]|uniref:hypothetical protein n=1 Tax=Virgibacillus phasianinus TaxID=2017483 RepID=UPI001FE4B506|nr:hypothetical protein [Virgibacillus phasianinus]
MKNKLNRGTENKVYIGIMIVAGLVLGVFFTSKTWMYDDTTIEQTPFNESIGGLSQTTVVLRDWEFNPANQLMEVTLETVHTGTDVVEPTFTFESKGKESGATYPVNKVYESVNLMVIQIEQVPKTYQAIGLFVTEHRDEKILKQAYEKQVMHDSDVATTATNEITASEIPEPEEIVLVGDYRKIDTNQSLVTKTEEAYQKETIRADMKRIKHQLSKLVEESTPFQEKLIMTLKQEKEELRQKMKFETKEEQSETKKEMNHKKDAIKDAKEEIEKLQEKIKELKDKYKNREKKLDALTQNKVEDQQQKNEETNAVDGKNAKKDVPKNKADKNNNHPQKVVQG